MPSRMKQLPVAIAACLVVALACKQRPSEPGHNPDLIYILAIDALRSDVIGLRHNGELVMPELTKFAEESVYFDHAYAQAPFTKISVASLFTGLWPTRLGVKHCILDTFPKGVELCRDLGFQFDTMAEYLSESGYRTITHLFTYHARRGSGLLQGFDHQEKTLEKWQPGSRKAFYYQHIIGLHAPYKAAKASLDRLSIGPPGGDADPRRSDWYWQPLTREQGMHLYEHYLALGDGADREFARLRRALMKQGIWDEALIVVTADHGTRSSSTKKCSEFRSSSSFRRVARMLASTAGRFRTGSGSSTSSPPSSIS